MDEAGISQLYPVGESESATPVESPAIRVDASNVSGGGFQNDVTITDDGQTVFSSADVSGVSRSTDGGLRFETINDGLRSLKVASLAITPDNDQIIYAGTGDKGASGGLFRSVNGGEQWELTGAGDRAQFAGNHPASGDPVPKGHPRSNGELIVVDPGEDPATWKDDIIIAGTYKQGVHLFAQGGDVEVSAVNTSGFVRSIARNAGLPDIVYAAIQFADSTKNGIYKIDYTDPSAPKSVLAYPVSRPEGLLVLGNGNVYAATGMSGVVKYSGDSWELLDLGRAEKSRYRQWVAVAGYSHGDNDIVYAGVNNTGGRAHGSNYSSVWRTVNGGHRWSPLVNAAENVADQIHGQSHDWWFRTKAFPQAGLGRTNSIVSSLAVARGDSTGSVQDDIIYVSGRGGLWKSGDGGQSWEPAVNNLQSTSNNAVAVNPDNPRQVALANTDFVVLETGSAFDGSDISRDKPRGSASKGYDIVFDGESGELIVGVGHRDRNEGGEVFTKPASRLGKPSGDGWVDTKLSEATSVGDGRVRAVSVGYHDGTSKTSQTLLAVVEGEGVFRRQEGTWIKARGVKTGSTVRSQFAWPNNRESGIVYLIDSSSGLYRSRDGGRSWVNIWPEMSFNNGGFYNTGYMAVDDRNPSTLYVSIQGGRKSPMGSRFGVYRMRGAETGLFGPPGTPGIDDIAVHAGDAPVRRPGPLAFGPDGTLWLTQQQDSRQSVRAALFMMEDPDTDTSFVEVTNEQYRRAASSPSGMDVSKDGHIYIAQPGAGLVKIMPLF